MEAIYRPRGPALEYAPLACNIYKGCTFACRYCYGPAAIHKNKAQYFKRADPKTDILDKLRRDASLCAGDKEVLLSFIGDPYQPYEKEARLTRQALKILYDAGVPFTVLTKAGRLVERDFDIIASHPGARLGVSLVWCCDDGNRVYWEPFAASVAERMDLLVRAFVSGIKTWVSLEPVIVPDQALEVIRELRSIVDHWMIGKINHMPAIEKSVDWTAFKARAAELLEDAGASYNFKDSLKHY